MTWSESHGVENGKKTNALISSDPGSESQAIPQPYQGCRPVGGPWLNIHSGWDWCDVSVWEWCERGKKKWQEQIYGFLRLSWMFAFETSTWVCDCDRQRVSCPDIGTEPLNLGAMKSRRSWEGCDSEVCWLTGTGAVHKLASEHDDGKQDRSTTSSVIQFTI